MANPSVIPGPPVLDLPISNHGDLYVVFKYKPLVVDGSGNPVLDGQGKYQFAFADYPVGSTVNLIIDHATPITGAATITAGSAEVWLDKAIVAPVPAKTTWSLVLTFSNGLDKVIMNGPVIRKNGDK